MALWHILTKALLLSVLILLQAVMALSAHAQEWIYTVRPGDNPWSISDNYLIDMSYWPKLQERNGISKPNQIPPGTRLNIPIEWLKKQIRPITVRVLDARGKVEVTLANGRTTPLDAETTLQAGDSIRTGPQSSVLLKFYDASELLLQSNSTLLLKTVSVDESSNLVDAQLNLQSGRLETKVTHRDDPRVRYEIRTPSAVAAVRGTEFRMAADSLTQTAYTEVTNGAVGVNAHGRISTLPEKFGSVSKPGAGRLDVVALLPPPDISALPENASDLRFSWQAIPGAKAYRIQIMAYQHKRFELLVFNNGRLIHSEKVGGGEQVLALIYEEVLQSPEFSGPKLPNDNYLLRVRGIDDQGLEGLNGEHRFTLFSSSNVAYLQ